MNKQFFVYIHCKPNGDPFYVGKGLLTRAHSLKPRNPHYRNVLMKYGSDNITIQVFLQESEQHAFDAEVALIAKLRAEGFILCNMTNGGEGVSGLTVSPETIAKRAVAIKEAFAKSPKVNPQSQREKARINALGNKNCVGRKVPDETRAKISATMTGRKNASGHVLSESAKEKIRQAKIGTTCAAGHHPSEEVRARWSEVRKGRPWTAARRAAFDNRGSSSP